MSEVAGTRWRRRSSCARTRPRVWASRTTARAPVPRARWPSRLSAHRARARATASMRRMSRACGAHHRYNIFYTPDAKHSTWVINRGYLPAGRNLCVVRAWLDGLSATTTDARARLCRIAATLPTSPRSPSRHRTATSRRCVSTGCAPCARGTPTSHRSSCWERCRSSRTRGPRRASRPSRTTRSRPRRPSATTARTTGTGSRISGTCVCAHGALA